MLRTNTVPRMDKLRRHRGALRGATTRLLSEASDILLEDTLPSSADLRELIEGLRDKDSAFAELNKHIAQALNGEEFDEEIMGAPDYHEKMVKAISRLPSAMNVVHRLVLPSSKPTSRGMRVEVTDAATPRELPTGTPPTKTSPITAGNERRPCKRKECWHPSVREATIDDCFKLRSMFTT
ncbi:hypothetical protein MTO96_004614 [Rhipicephalus appendiculatus]